MNTLLHLSKLKLFVSALLVFLLTNIQAAVTWTVGSYVGTGANLTISSLAFQPDFVMIKSAAATSAYVKTSTMVSNVSRQYTSVSAGVTDAITSLTSNGFTLGTNSYVNTSGTTYYFYAFKAGNSIKVGKYTGSGGTSTVTVGANVSWALVFPRDNYGSSASFYEPSGGAGGYSYDARWTTGISVATGEAQPANPSWSSSTSFPVQSGAPYTNVSSQVYDYVGFVANAGECVMDSYTGNGSARNISISGFKPNFVMTVNTGGGGEVVFKGGNITGTNSQYTNNIANAGSLITGFASVAGGNG